MRTLLAAPVRIRGTAYANLFLSERRDEKPFDDLDEQRVHALSTIAGIVIENQLSYSLSERRRRWLETFSELNELLLPPIGLDAAFEQIADAVLSASQANAVAIVQVPSQGDRVRVAALRGSTTRPHDLTDEQRGEVAQVARAAVASGAPMEVPVDSDRVAVFVPLRAHLTLPGVILVEFERSALSASDGEDRELLASFAEQAGLALDRAQALQERAEMAVVSDRDRIARDLHDVVIQRLFAAGLHLQKTRSMADDDILGARLDLTMKDLDQTIRDIRGTIFELQTRPQASLRNEIRDLVREYVPVLGFAPSVQMNGPVDSALEPGLQQHLVAVLREALSNIARHSGATSAGMELTVTGQELSLTVSDNGVGLPEERRESGLNNAKRRAAMLGGTFEIAPGEPRGTVLHWQVPVPAPAD